MKKIKLIESIRDGIPINSGIPDISDIMNKKIEEDPTSINSNVLKIAIENGILKNPTEFTKAVANVGSYGFFDKDI